MTTHVVWVRIGGLAKWESIYKATSLNEAVEVRNVVANNRLSVEAICLPIDTFPHVIKESEA